MFTCHLPSTSMINTTNGLPSYKQTNPCKFDISWSTFSFCFPPSNVHINGGDSDRFPIKVLQWKIALKDQLNYPMSPFFMVLYHYYKQLGEDVENIKEKIPIVYVMASEKCIELQDDDYIYYEGINIVVLWKTKFTLQHEGMVHNFIGGYDIDSPTSLSASFMCSSWTQEKQMFKWWMMKKWKVNVMEMEMKNVWVGNWKLLIKEDDSFQGVHYHHEKEKRKKKKDGCLDKTKNNTDNNENHVGWEILILPCHCTWNHLKNIYEHRIGQEIPFRAQFILEDHTKIDCCSSELLSTCHLSLQEYTSLIIERGAIVHITLQEMDKIQYYTLMNTSSSSLGYCNNEQMKKLVIDKLEMGTMLEHLNQRWRKAFDDKLSIHDQWFFILDGHLKKMLNHMELVAQGIKDDSILFLLKESLVEKWGYQCGECNRTTYLSHDDLVRCDDCGSRVFLKPRTTDPCSYICR
jgi:DNA-directed RNA polymerase subunit RPC12/RpoP